VGHMVGCSGAQINLSVKYAIRLPANDCLERDIAELQSKTWKLGRKGVAGAKSGRKVYEDSRRAPPYGAGQHGRRSNRAVSRHTKRAPAENRRTAMKKGQPKLVVVGRRFTMGLHNGA
jgi:hypothetical protein